ncbi:MAG TPA: GDSL-type esterase/lipase family protein [Candidatus Saccharimonadales bacterium]|nr:GDSL-type esterase/lipase family protein [Candidatus Saccharimonadales bacterium]
MLPKKIVAIGSSTLFGRVDPQGGGYIGRLRSWHEENDPHNAVFNLGISGETTADMLKRLVSEAIIRNPNLIILTSGSNDTRRIGSKNSPVNTSLEQFRKNINEMIRQAKQIAPIVFVSIYPINESNTAPLRYWHDTYYYLLQDAIEYAQAVKEICNDNNIPYLDIFNKWLKEDYFEYLFEDGLHANAKGHEIIFNSLKLFLQSLYEI